MIGGMSEAEHVVVMTTTDDPEEAATPGAALVEARLAACVQAMPIAPDLPLGGRGRDR